MTSESGPEVITSHLVQCTQARAALVVDGSADGIIARLTAAGWTLEERTDLVAGKRIRFLRAPGEE